MKQTRIYAMLTLTSLLTVTVFAEPVTLSKDVFLDKLKGAWAGQMIGVCYGAPYEFQSCGKPITGPIQEWTPERVAGALDQDDCYVEMTFLKALEDYGLGISFEQAGKAFGASQYELWHANKAGRENVRHGIMPPDSGNPKNNRHADDIDFQIEADLFGILCPGLPQESNRLCDVFGHIMNYGDGVYGGMFISGMYSAAYFEDKDVEKVVRAGLGCIPKESTYHQCISDVIQWHSESPKDWLAVWKKIEAKWQDDVDCSPGNPFNIDAKLNGAYVVMGLLYGEGDVRKTMEYAVRCGQDADCNPSNAAGVLGCMKGFKALDAGLTGGIAAIKDKRFSYTSYSFETLIPACERVTEQIVKRAGGEVKADAYVFARQEPKALEKLEQWSIADKKAAIGVAISPVEIAVWNPKWKEIACGTEMDPGVRSEYHGKKNVLVLHPVSREKAAAISAEYQVPQGAAPKMTIDVASDERGDFRFKALVNEDVVADQIVDTKGEWKQVVLDLAEYAGRTITVRIEDVANDWKFEAAYLGAIELQ
ncbi:MAG: ADP-ribosylglycohydrolase family protein [Candidatus Hydrogenedentes bacterium]|nr:ADP-ribosylglycohydrolase family protein [Candidatus Hydrogenedentota bacterium]